MAKGSGGGKAWPKGGKGGGMKGGGGKMGGGKKGC